MKNSNGKAYISRNIKGTVITVCAVLFAVGVLVCVFALLQTGRTVRKRSGNSGLGRYPMFPFYYTDSGSLYVVKDASSGVQEADDSVEKCVTVSLENSVYYLRENIFYRYSAANGKRTKIENNVCDFTVSEDGKIIVYEKPDGSVYIRYGSAVKMIFQGTGRTDSARWEISDGKAVFLLNESERTCLRICDIYGNEKILTEKADFEGSFGKMSDNSLYYYMSDGILFVVNESGNEVFRLEGGSVLTDDVNSGAGNYVYDSKGALYYVMSSEAVKITDSLYKVISFSRDDGFLVYSASENDMICIYTCIRGKSLDRQRIFSPDTVFVYEDIYSILYCLGKDGVLKSYNIYDVNLEITAVAYHIESIDRYEEKGFVVCRKDNEDKTLIVRNNAVIQESEGKNDLFLYGRPDDVFLLVREREDCFSVDYGDSDGLMRICPKGNVVAFDEKVEYVLYYSDEGLYLWHGGENVYIGKCSDIVPVPDAGAKTGGGH